MTLTNAQLLSISIQHDTSDAEIQEPIVQHSLEAEQVATWNNTDYEKNKFHEPFDLVKARLLVSCWSRSATRILSCSLHKLQFALRWWVRSSWFARTKCVFVVRRSVTISMMLLSCCGVPPDPIPEDDDDGESGELTTLGWSASILNYTHCMLERLVSAHSIVLESNQLQNFVQRCCWKLWHCWRQALVKVDLKLNKLKFKTWKRSYQWLQLQRCSHVPIIEQRP